MADPIRRAEKFIRGLDPHIQVYLICTPPTTHEAALASARSWELITEEQRAAQARTAARRAPPALPAPSVPLALPAPPAPRAPPASSAPAVSSASVWTPAAIRTVQTTSFKPVPSPTALTGVNRIPIESDFCHKPGHSRQTCRRLLRLCLRCGQA